MTGDIWSDLLGARAGMAKAHKKMLNEMISSGLKRDKNGCYKY